jgi:WhiB family redox-sensing transcriptional regulator
LFIRTTTTSLDTEPTTEKAPAMLATTTLEPEPTADSALHGAATAPSAQAVLDPWAKARCRDGNGTLTHLFFSEDALLIARAKAICSRCTVSAACLEEAVERAEPWGVWGGQLLVNGTPVMVKRGRGRPPKHPRPALVVDEVPIPPLRAALVPERVA